MNHFLKDDQMNALIVNKVLSLILRQIQFRKIMNDTMIVNDKKIMIEQNILLYEIMIVELRLLTIQKNFYHFIHNRLIDILNKNVDKKFREKRMNMTTHRILCHIVTNKRLFIIKKRLIFRDDLNVNTLNIWHEQLLKNRIYLYWAHITRNSIDLSHIDCMINAYYIVFMLFKMQYLTWLLRYICFEWKEKIIIFVDWSFTLFMYKLFMNLIEIKHVIIMIN